DNGVVAFIGQHLTGAGVFVNDTDGTRGISGGSTFDQNLQLDDVAQVNNANHVLAWQRLAGAPPVTSLRLWDVSSGTFTNVATSADINPYWASVSSFGSVNNADQVVFSGLPLADQSAPWLATGFGPNYNAFPAGGSLSPRPFLSGDANGHYVY